MGLFDMIYVCKNCKKAVKVGLSGSCPECKTTPIGCGTDNAVSEGKCQLPSVWKKMSTADQDAWVNSVLELASAEPDGPKEYRKKCNVCGHIFCYTDSDLEKNKQYAKEAKSSTNMAIMEALAGTRLASNQQGAAADRARDKIVDYSKCPKCNSTNLTDATEDEVSQATNGNSGSVVSAADELKKFKELLDMGVITQEEFDAKKKQLLGL